MRALINFAGSMLALATASLCAQTVSPVKSVTLRIAPGVVVRTAPPARLDVSRLDSFTPSFMDSGQIGRVGLPAGFVRPPSLSESLLGIGENGSLTFTPSGRSSQSGAFSLGVTSQVREGGRIVSTSSSGRPTTQNVAVTVGYAGFALEAGFSRIAQTAKAVSQGVDVGVSYQGKDWKTGLMVSKTDVGLDVFGLPGVFNPETTRAVEFGAAYELTSWLAINGGLRYQIFSPNSQLFAGGPVPANVNAGAVYFGTQLKF